MPGAVLPRTQPGPDRQESRPLASITLSTDLPSNVAGDALVVGVAKASQSKRTKKPQGGKSKGGEPDRERAEAGNAPVIVGPDASGALRELARTLADLGVTGAPDEVVRVPAPAGVAAAF